MTTKTQLQEAFKLAFALVLAYWFSLYMNWDMPKYSALAVVLISQGTFEASVQKGLMRIIGTFVGVCIGFSVIDWFGQDRVLTLLFFASYLLLIGCAMQASRTPYVWFVTGFVPMLVWSSSYMQPDTAFHYGVFRFLETASGIIFFTLVSCLVWPRYSDEKPGKNNKWNPLSSTQVYKAAVPSVCFVVSYLFWIFTDPPGGPSIPAITSIFSLVLLLTPIDSLKLLVMTLISLWVIIAPFYFLLMPSLSNGLDLLTAIFLFAITLGYLGLKYPFLQTLPLAFFVMSTNITNQQNYSFLGFVNLGMVIIIAISTNVLVKLFMEYQQKEQISSSQTA